MTESMELRDQYVRYMEDKGFQILQINDELVENFVNLQNI